ncbi:MAG: hypothetical protein HOH38_06745 [Nitrospinaceae bacterium]|nr:hypothetical protein [Nitrospina sp.]MBT5868515.1 hypothetical protein [Nitrospinaceae bacterium]MBT6346675.1 hypothetical protein [Nitrospina sp.]
MPERHKKPKMAQFLKDNQKRLQEFNDRKGEKYTREPWMLNANPAAEWTTEILVESEQADH